MALHRDVPGATRPPSPVSGSELSIFELSSINGGPQRHQLRLMRRSCSTQAGWHNAIFAVALSVHRLLGRRSRPQHRSLSGLLRWEQVCVPGRRRAQPGKPQCPPAADNEVEGLSAHPSIDGYERRAAGLLTGRFQFQFWAGAPCAHCYFAEGEGEGCVLC